ncbi:hypothetical protein PPL_10299 [Heterostelium album PN500]|uniref:Purple acid phosphatase N-terminal domain-containing protein n=1 Tax=Heterostelium pallidum (strain ATCC 26659 / Pp 5 / PN500) TaxID=670386 RepID=D3BQW1_HETP5|nr:hypothetical protein PPL_10299 [Heterostelium album PN500]EFA76531.1 hypothetical protein PPL_10299 [Heterostelium album PN500]|eukprot:XP_020428663.1 hypothetical protein PPL_10299 [Heterostelium album PN500]
MTELTYREKGFLAFFLTPLFSKLLPTSKVHHFFTLLKAGTILSFAFVISALSSWQYIVIAPVLIIIFIYLLFASLIHLRGIPQSHTHIALSDIELMPGVSEAHHNNSNNSVAWNEFEVDEDDYNDSNAHGELNDINSKPTFRDPRALSRGNNRLANAVDNVKRTAKNLVSIGWYRKQLALSRDDIVRSPKTSIFLMILVLVFAIVVPLALDRVCVCSHPMTISVRLTRSTYCSNDEICHLYLTLPEDPSHSMILQYHTRDFPSDFCVTVQSPSGENTTVGRSFIQPMDSIIKEESRYVSTHYLDNLQPNTIYSLSVCYNKGKVCSPIHKFRTLPIDNDTPVRFVVGGDIQLNKDARDLAAEAIKKRFSPLHFVVIGGDVAYAEGVPACYQRWDEKLAFLISNFGNTSEGLMLPFLFAIGNHEAGAFFQPRSSVPFFFRYTSFTAKDAHSSPQTRSSYHMHQLSSFGSLAILDSCVISCWGPQSTWLDDQWSSTKDNITNRVVIYHSPIYPAGSQPLTAKIPSMGQSTITKIFDKYNVSLVLENHEHIFKRTKPLRNGKVDEENGTVYVGGGAFGIGSRTKPGNTTNLPWFLEKRSLTK